MKGTTKALCWMFKIHGSTYNVLERMDCSLEGPVEDFLVLK